MKTRNKILLGLLAAFVFIQLIPVPKTNPPVTGEIAAPPEVKSVLRKSCYDCHSNETVWPWYSRLAPVSWLLYRDVTQGRRTMNFSAWQQMPQDRQNRRRKGVWDEVASGDMPLWFYKPLHADAKLTDADKATLKAWSDAGPAVPKRNAGGNTGG
jgi:hypothetical protein